MLGVTSCWMCAGRWTLHSQQPYQEIQELVPDGFVVEEAHIVSCIPSVAVTNDAAALGPTFE